MLLKIKKFKKDRSLMQNTWGFRKSPFNRRKYKPGIHKGRNLSSTLYGNLLVQRQRLRNFYFNLKAKQLKTLIKKSLKSKSYKEIIIKSLESRIDTTLFRSGFAISFSMARQMINHKQVYVNGCIANSPSFLLGAGDKLTFKETVNDMVKNNILKVGRKVPNYIIISKDNCSLTFNSSNLPKTENELMTAFPLSIDDVVRSYKI